jgi:methyl-accepting chemotaxis protein
VLVQVLRGLVANRSVRTKLAMIAVVGLAAVLLVDLVGIRALGAAAQKARQLDEINGLTRVALEADMAHDAIRGDVQRVLLAAGGPDAAAAREDLANHVPILRDGVQTFRGPGVTEDVRHSAESVQTAVQRYIDLAQQMVNQAQSRPGTPSGYQEFMAAFSAVEDQLPAIGDALSAQAKQASLAVEQQRSTAIAVLVAVGVLCALLLTLGCWIVAGGILRPLREVSRVLGAMAHGDLTVTARVTANDELGQMAGALNGSVAHVRQMVVALSGSATTVTDSAEQLSDASAQISSSAHEASTTADTVTAAASQVSDHMNTLAAASDQMGMSIKEIARSAGEAARVAADAVTVAEETNETITKLQASSIEIDAVVRMIGAVAEQTNLLALNATIEAARAGEAGRGFAVVAGEVKDLAQETARATEQITQKVEAIRADTDNAVATIGQIGGIVSRINDLQTMIAAAVEEQTATTAEMNRSITEAAAQSTDIAMSIGSVSITSSETNRGASTCLAAAQDMATTADQLRRVVNDFTC